MSRVIAFCSQKWLKSLETETRFCSTDFSHGTLGFRPFSIQVIFVFNFSEPLFVPPFFKSCVRVRIHTRIRNDVSLAPGLRDLFNTVVWFLKTSVQDARLSDTNPSDLPGTP